MKDTYQTIAASSEGEFKDRGSKFIAYAFPVYEEEEIQQRLLEVRKLHIKARHHCYAYRLGLDKNNFRANDDGEPSGTAGRPILGQLDSNDLTYVLVVVVRYFGGTKLGTSGLINAYRTSTQEALEQATILAKTVEEIYRIDFDYALMSDVMNTVKKLDLEIVRQEFGNTAYLEVAIRLSECEMTLRQLRSGISKIRMEEIDKVKKVPGLEIKHSRTR